MYEKVASKWKEIKHPVIDSIENLLPKEEFYIFIKNVLKDRPAVFDQV